MKPSNLSSRPVTLHNIILGSPGKKTSLFDKKHTFPPAKYAQSNSSGDIKHEYSECMLLDWWIHIFIFFIKVICSGQRTYRRKHARFYLFSKIFNRNRLEASLKSLTDWLVKRVYNAFYPFHTCPVPERGTSVQMLHLLLNSRVPTQGHESTWWILIFFLRDISK